MTIIANISGCEMPSTQTWFTRCQNHYWIATADASALLTKRFLNKQSSADKGRQNLIKTNRKPETRVPQSWIAVIPDCELVPKSSSHLGTFWGNQKSVRILIVMFRSTKAFSSQVFLKQLTTGQTNRDKDKNKFISNLTAFSACT